MFLPVTGSNAITAVWLTKWISKIHLEDTFGPILPLNSSFPMSSFFDVGDVFFHHGNLLHRSDANLSDRPRMAFLSCYNPAHNSPVIDDEYPKYNKIDIVSLF